MEELSLIWPLRFSAPVVCLNFHREIRLIIADNAEITGQRKLETDAEATDGLELFVFANEGGWNVRLVARLDNLGKGASGAAAQNLNLMCGLPETAGLRLASA